MICRVGPVMHNRHQCERLWLRIVRHEIPLPPIDTQRAIVAELEAEQALVEANRELVERMEKKIQAAIGRVWG